VPPQLLQRRRSPARRYTIRLIAQYLLQVKYLPDSWRAEIVHERPSLYRIGAHSCQSNRAVQAATYLTTRHVWEYGERRAQKAGRPQAYPFFSQVLAISKKRTPVELEKWLARPRLSRQTRSLSQQTLPALAWDIRSWKSRSAPVLKERH
jgi:hypothetical protein